MSALVAPTTPSSAEVLASLCKQRKWQAVIEHVRAHPISHPADLAKGQTGTKLLPLHLACEKGAPLQVIKVLLNANPSAVHAKCGPDRLPLHCLLAAAASYPLSDNAVSTLIEAYPNACRIADKDGNLPIHYACLATPCSDNIFTSILSMYPEAAYQRNTAGDYPLHVAQSNKDLKTRNTALAALDRGTLYASISHMTTLCLSKENEAQKKALNKAHADERSKLKAQIDSLKTQLKTEKQGNTKLQEDVKAMNVQHKENVAVAIQKEQAKASDLEKKLRLELADVRLKNMDFVEQVETVQTDLDVSNQKVEKQAGNIKELEEKLEDTSKMLVDTKDALETTGKELRATQDELSSAQTTNEEKSKCIMHLETSLQTAQESVLALVKEQERMNAAMISQNEALSALLVGHDTAMDDAGALKEKMETLASDIGKATDKESENGKTKTKEEEKKEEQ